MRSFALKIAVTAIVAFWVASASVSAGTAAKGRAVSLNALAAAMRGGSTVQPRRFCGITEVLGYLPDAKSHDIIIIGKVDPNLPELHLDDLVVAIRNAWYTYSQVQGRIRYYSAPGCSIDPDPRVLRELNDMQQVRGSVFGAEETQAYVDQWKAIGAKPQKVRVLGVPFDCRFAKVMVDADYYMKRLVNGSVTLDIHGFESLTGMRDRISQEQIQSGTSPGDHELSLNRFWFSPGETTFEEKNGMVLLRDCAVRLLTEEEFLTEHNVVAGTGHPDSLAGQFAASFSKNYTAIAQARPIYKELEALFRFAALARLMRDDRADLISQTGFGYLLKAHRIECVPVSRAVNGLADVRITTKTLEIQDGVHTTRTIQSFCGGVSMDVQPRRIKSAPHASAPASAPVAMASTPAVPRVASSPSKSVPGAKAGARPASSRQARVASAPRRNAILSARKSTKQVSWDIPLQDIE